MPSVARPGHFDGVDVPLEDWLVPLPDPESVEVPVEVLPLPLPVAVPVLPPLVVLLVVPVEPLVLDPDDVVPEESEPLVDDELPVLLVVCEPVPVEEVVDVVPADTAVPVVSSEPGVSVVAVDGDGDAAGGGAACDGELTLGGAISSGGADGGGAAWTTLCLRGALVVCDAAAVASFDCVISETPTATAAASVSTTGWLVLAPGCTGSAPAL